MGILVAVKINVTFAYLQKILKEGKAIGAIRKAVFAQITFDILAGWWPVMGNKLSINSAIA